MADKLVKQLVQRARDFNGTWAQFTNKYYKAFRVKLTQEQLREIEEAFK